MLDDPAVQARLLPLLPEEQRTAGELRSLVRSPQFQQALGSLSSALHNPDNFNSVFANFGLDPADGAQALAGGDAMGARGFRAPSAARRAALGDEAEAPRARAPRALALLFFPPK